MHCWLQDPKHKKGNDRRKRLIDLLVKNNQYQEVLNELMLTFLLDLETIKQQVSTQSYHEKASEIAAVNLIP